MSKNASSAKKSHARHAPHPQEFIQAPVFEKFIPVWKRFLPEILIGLSVILLSLYAGRTYMARRSLKMNQGLVAEYQEKNGARKPKPVRVTIPNLLSTSVEEAYIEGNNWYISTSSATHVTQSANPGESGNIIIYGHNQRSILGNIRSLSGFEKIILTTDDGTEHEYQIIAFYEVDPEQVQFLKPTQEETLTLYTCSGLFEQNRYIIRAVPTGGLSSLF